MAVITYPVSPLRDAEFTDSNGVIWTCNNSTTSGDIFTSWIRKVIDKGHNDFEGVQGGSDNDKYHVDIDQYNAIVNSNSPATGNPFATVADIPASLQVVDKGKNLIINGGFNVQERTSTASVTHGVYITDRWHSVLPYRNSMSVYADYDLAKGNGVRCVNTGTSSLIGIGQMIENGKMLQGSKLTLAFDWVPVSGITSLEVALWYLEDIQLFISVPDPLVAERKVVRLTVPTSTLTAVQMHLQVSIAAVCAVGAEFKIYNVAIIAGHEVTGDFPPDVYADEFSKCQRYFQKRSGLTGRSVGGNTTSLRIPHSFPTELQADPTLTLTYSWVGNPNVGGIIAVIANKYGISRLNIVNVLAAGDYTGFEIDYTVDAEIYTIWN